MEDKKETGHETEDSKQETKHETQDSRLAELEEKLLRLHAEFENFRKRNAKEQEALAGNANAALLLKLLPVVDEMEIAASHHAKHDGKHGEGVAMVYRNMMKVLAHEGLEDMNSLGKPFDPYYHEALRQGDGEEGKVVEIIQKGYLFKGKVLRHAKVIVGNGNHVHAKKENKEEKGDLK